MPLLNRIITRVLLLWRGVVNTPPKQQVSENLRLAFLTTRSREKPGVLLFVLRDLLGHKAGHSTSSMPYDQAYGK